MAASSSGAFCTAGRATACGWGADELPAHPAKTRARHKIRNDFTGRRLYRACRAGGIVRETILISAVGDSKSKSDTQTTTCWKNNCSAEVMQRIADLNAAAECYREEQQYLEQ